MWGEPTRKKELLYIKDFVKAVALAVESSACGLMNLPGYRPYTLDEQIDGLINAFAPSAQRSGKIYMPQKPDTPQNLLAPGKAKSELHWEPEYPWETACQDMRRALVQQPFQLLWGKNSPEDSY